MDIQPNPGADGIKRHVRSPRGPKVQEAPTNQSVSVASDQGNRDIERARAIAALVAAHDPQDAVETLLANQMALVAVTAADCFGRATIADVSPAVRDGELRHAAKLLNLHQRLLEFYEKRRGPVYMGGFSMKKLGPAF